ncbi:unnamed protein product [Echinostoma caproni]|uniref:Rho-GAP domain-containing protein n=1 Tax=Echinostoma caproni TaxID=27848 RepID=A0A183A9T0_9TREM|nr:unnamed protein product [Echinostoma caproni]
MIQNYANRLRQGVEENSVIQDFRLKFPQRFHELCMVHLSFLIDIPWNIYDQRSGTAQDSTPKSALKRLLAASRFGHNPTKTDPTPEFLVNNALHLIDRLNDDQSCAAEGIFRKAGHMQRKRQLLDALLLPEFDPDSIPWDVYTVHDLATALKSLIAHLPSPLLTNRLIPLFLRVAGHEVSRRPVERLHNNRDRCNLLAETVNPEFNRPAIRPERASWSSVNYKRASTCGVGVDMRANVIRLRTMTTSTGLIEPEVQGMVHSFDALATPVSSNEGQSMDNVHWDLIRSKQLKALRLLVQLLPSSNRQLFNRLMALLDRVVRSQSSNRMTSENLGTVFGPVFFPNELSQDVTNTSKVLRVFQGPDDSPPLHTGIRFATPTLVSTANAPTHFSSPKRVNSSPSMINIVQNRTHGACELATHTETPDTPKQSTLTGKGHSLFSSRCESPTQPPSASAPKTQRRGSFLTAHLPRSDSTSVKHSVSIPDLEGSSTRKPGKKRRYTELRLPSSITRNGPRRHFFSPCPPLGFHPFRRPMVEKRSPSPGLNLRPHATEIQPLSTW